MTKLRGVEAAGEALIRAGVKLFCLPSSPILSELEDYLEARTHANGAFDCLSVQSEEEAVHIVFGSSAGSVLAATAAEGSGVQRIYEGLGCLAAAELPAVAIAIMTGGPGIGSIFPSQHLYRLVVGGAGLPMPVLAPASVQEIAELAGQAGALAASFQTPVVLLMDAALARITDAVDLDSLVVPDGSKVPRGQGSRIRVLTAYCDLEGQEQRDLRVTERLERVEIPRATLASGDPEPEVLIIGFGSAAMAAAAALPGLLKAELSARVLRLRLLSPFPSKQVASELAKAKLTLVLELNTGQMVHDVAECTPSGEVLSLALPGQDLPQPEELARLVLRTLRKEDAAH